MPLFLLPMALLLASPGNALYGEGAYCVPEDVKTYEVIEGGASLGFGGIRYKGEDEWLGDTNPSVEEMITVLGKSQIEFLLDQPWEPVRPVFLILKKENLRIEPERRTERTRRLKEGWDTAGYVFENDMYILRKDLEKLNTALAMASQSAEDSSLPILKGSGVIKGPPSLIRQFWLHGLILVGGLLVLGVLVKVYFLP